MTASRVPQVAEALAREFALALERTYLHARMLEGASSRARRAAELADPLHEQSVAFMIEQIRRAVLDLSGALVSLVEESGRIDALIQTRALLQRQVAKP